MSAPAREAIATRLLGGSVKRSYSPVVDLDWDAPLEEGKYFLPPRVCSLYGTDLWNGLTEEQRIEVSRQEMANILSIGIWFENLLNRALLQRLMTEDPASASSHYALTEMGDECRHMVMFGRAIERSGARPYGMSLPERIIMSLLPFGMRGSLLWVAALVGEEIFDALQREMLDDPQLQPLVSRLMRIHVTEEARHIGFARDGVVRRRPIRGRWESMIAANVHGLSALRFKYLFTNPAMYARAGLDKHEATKAARSNPNFHRMQVLGFSSLGKFLEDNGLMSRFARGQWRRAGFLE
ncbi:AurF N-oxygenase family protein [Williamsia soli]|uniref:AurF N-oxygenase family protein n=1 Tax=Williamsia soli TaxID=364929 RepID=UPI001A9D83F9|nr:diiron oxygenase [Williamsia soli]